jgi:hypothetical protein
MKFSFIFLIFTIHANSQVFKNPGIPESESYEISDRIDEKIGYVNAQVNIKLEEANHFKYYLLSVNEGNIFLNEIKINYSDLTTLSEKRKDLRSNTLIESYQVLEENEIRFYNKEKEIDADFTTDDMNIYSRYAYFFSFRGFPFDSEKEVCFKTYMFEYGNALTMKAINLGKTNVTVKAGIFECYKLELSVAGWQSLFAPDKYYLYFAVAGTHQFVKYEEKDGDIWNANELTKILK